MRGARRRLVATMLATATVAACGAAADAGADEHLTGPTALVVAAAADLRPAFEEIGQLFAAETGHEVVFDFGSSGQLAQRIIEGAPVDVFASADIGYVDTILAQGRGQSGSRATYAFGRIAIWSRADVPMTWTTIADLIHDDHLGVLAIANPAHAPYGRAARQAIEASGLWEEAEPRLVFGENIVDAHRLAATGNADAALTALSLAIASGDSGQWTLIDDTLHQPLEQALVVVTTDPNRHPVAAAFADFVNQPAARSVMTRHGFLLPGEAAP